MQTPRREPHEITSLCHSANPSERETYKSSQTPSGFPEKTYIEHKIYRATNTVSSNSTVEKWSQRSKRQVGLWHKARYETQMRQNGLHVTLTCHSEFLYTDTPSRCLETLSRFGYSKILHERFRKMKIQIDQGSLWGPIATIPWVSFVDTQK